MVPLWDRKFHSYTLSARLSAAGERERKGERKQFRVSRGTGSASGSWEKALTQQLDPAVNSSFTIHPPTLKGGISFVLPVSLSMFVSLYPFTLSGQTSYLSPLPFPTLLCPSCGSVSPLHLLLVPSRVVTCGWSRWEQLIFLSVEAQASRGWWEHLVGGWCAHLTQSRFRIIQFDDATMK